MAKNILFKGHIGQYWIRRNNLDDVMDVSRFRNKSIRSHASFWKQKRERESRQTSKDVFVRMCELLATDLVENQDAFVLPARKVGYLCIGNSKHRFAPHKYRPTISQEDTGFPIGLVILDKLVVAVNGGRQYLFKLTQPWIKRLRELRAQGNRWP